MMQLLLESHTRPWLSLGTAASTAVHGILVALVVLAHQERPAAQGFVDQFVTYMVPPDKVRGPVGEGERPQAGWQGGGGSGAAEQTPAASPEGIGRLVVTEAEADVDDIPPAADPVAELLTDTSVLTELEVDSVVRRHPESASPNYPATLLEKNVEGSVFAIFVVDSTGRVDTMTFRVLRATHPEFVQAVRDVLPRMRFRPALVSGNAVPQLVQQPFAFRIRQAEAIPIIRRPPDR